MLLKKSRLTKRNILFITLALISFAFILNGCSSDDRIRGNGKMIDDELSITESIKKIDISGVSATLIVSPDKNDKVTYSIDENLKKLLHIEVNDGVLKISSNKKQNTLGYDNKIVFNIGTDILEEIYVYGDAEVKGDGTFTSDTFKTSIVGASKVNLDLNSKTTILNINGAADINFSGETNQLKIKSEGATKINTRELIAQDVTIDFNSVGLIQVFADNTLNVSGQGITSIKYWGDAEITGSVDGIASVKKGS